MFKKPKQRPELRQDWLSHQRAVSQDTSPHIDAASLNAVSDINSFTRLETWVDKNHEKTTAVADIFDASYDHSTLVTNLHIFSDLNIMLKEHVQGWSEPLCWPLLAILAWSTDPPRREFFINMLEALNSIRPYIVTIVKAMEHKSKAVTNLVDVAQETMMDFDAFVAAHVRVMGKASSETRVDDNVGDSQKNTSDIPKLNKSDIVKWEKWLRKRVPHSEGFAGRVRSKCRMGL